MKDGAKQPVQVTRAFVSELRESWNRNSLGKVNVIGFLLVEISSLALLAAVLWKIGGLAL